MKNSSLYIDGHKATVKYDPLIDMFRGEFIGTGKAATFIAGDVKELKIAAADSLAGYVSDCKRKGKTPFAKSDFSISNLIGRIIH